MKSNRSLFCFATVATTLLCFNLEAIALSQESGPFDIPSRSILFDKNGSIGEESRQTLRAKQHQDEVIQEILNTEQSPGNDVKKNRAQRIRERRENAKKIIREHQPDVGQLERMPADEIRRIYGNIVKDDPLLEKEDNRWIRGLKRNLSNNKGEFADIGQYYDSWAQGYRMLGAYVDCDARKGGHSHDNNNNGAGEINCSRWMMWAAYVNPNYGGGGRNEYFSEYYSTSNLDCHSENTDWQLLGVYRQELYQFIEQISKHVWAIDDYEYVVARAGMGYINEDCEYVGYDSYGNALYAGVQPVSGGDIMMGLYNDQYCLVEDTSSGMTYDSFGKTSNMDLGDKDKGNLDDDTLYTLYGYWKNTQEYTLTLLNEVYEEFKYCTLCMDYPTYQDGYFIGDTGTDDDDLINQCWKFHSHDSFIVDSTAIAAADAQGGIVRIVYGGQKFGTLWNGSSGSGSSSSRYGSGNASVQSKFSKFKANAYLTFNGVLFIATFLAFSVSRGNGKDKSGKRRSLLSKEERRAAKAKSPRSVSSKRSKKSAGSSSKKERSSSRSKSNGRSGSASRAGSASRRVGTYA